MRLLRRFSSSGMGSRTVGVVLDIDGVLVRGPAVIPGAQAALKKLQKHKIPYVFVTNGGGMLEGIKAKDLEKKLGVKVREDSVCLSHTPFMEAAKEYADKRVLVLGHSGCEAIARKYGFKKIVNAHQLHAETPSLFPLRPRAGITMPDHAPEKVAAVFVFHDPLDWALEVQVCLDLLSNDAAADSGAQSIPFYACNADLVYNTDHPTPRLTQGAFCEAFRHLFEVKTGVSLAIHFCGKPFTIQYKMAEAMLSREAARLKLPPPATYVGIGDNPKSDIRGARNAGANWNSVLVKTGVWVMPNANNDPTDPADDVCESITEAVDLVIEKFLQSSSHK